MVAQRRPAPVDRLRRIWHVAEEIAANPGHTRTSLAAMFHMSERQTQADLNVIRSEMGLPLVRQSGYRFVSEGGPIGGSGALTLQDAQVLLTMLSVASRDPSISRDRLDDLSARLPSVFAPHVQPIVRSVMRVLDARRQNTEQRVLIALLHAILRGLWVRLDQLPDERKPVIRPDILLPYRGYWYVLGESHRTSRNAAFCLHTVFSVETVTVEQKVVRTVRAAS